MIKSTAAAVLALVVASFAASAADDPEAVYAQFHRAALGGNIDSMKRLVTTAQRGRMGLSDHPELEAKQLAAVLPPSYSVTGKAVGANRAVLELRGRSGPALGGIEMQGRIVLVREDGAWKVEEPAWLPASYPAPQGPPPQVVSPGTPAVVPAAPGRAIGAPGAARPAR